VAGCSGFEHGGPAVRTDQDKQFKRLVRVGSAAAGNAATRIEAFVISGGSRSYGGYPDSDALFRDQAVEMDRKRRETLLHRIQQLMHERAMFAPIVEPPVSGLGSARFPRSRGTRTSPRTKT
jgi:peptide/nickel transport system substrate-binding protein